MHNIHSYSWIIIINSLSLSFQSSVMFPPNPLKLCIRTNFYVYSPNHRSISNFFILHRKHFVNKWHRLVKFTEPYGRDPSLFKSKFIFKVPWWMFCMRIIILNAHSNLLNTPKIQIFEWEQFSNFIVMSGRAIRIFEWIWMRSKSLLVMEVQIIKISHFIAAWRHETNEMLCHPIKIYQLRIFEKKKTQKTNTIE